MERLRRLDLPVVATVLFAVLVTALAGSVHLVAINRGCIELVVASSQEKTKLMQQAAAVFNASRPLVGGRCVDVTVEGFVSGAAEQALARGWNEQDGPRPDVWTPSSTTWLDLLDAHRGKLGSLFARDTLPTSLMKSPLVIAMPEDMARVLGWPNKPLGWQTIFDLARDPRGWAAYAHREWGAFRLGKTNPHLSTSGLNALISTYYVASGKRSDLTIPDLREGGVIDLVEQVESSVAHYGDTATNFLTALRVAADRNSSTPYVSAVAVEEKEVWNYNVGNVTGDPSLQPKAVLPTPRLAAIYPKEGTILADHPYALFQWATPEKKAASAKFLDHLLGETSQQLFKSAGFRDNRGFGGESQISTTNRLNPAPPSPILAFPPGDVIAAIQDSWNALRKPARVLIVVDVSAQVGAANLASIKGPLVGALQELVPGDQVGLWQAPGATQPFDELVQLGPLGTQSPIGAKIQGVRLAKRQASLVEVVRKSVAELRNSYDPRRIDAVVLLSPGTGATPDEVGLLLDDLRNQPADRSIHVFTVAYGDHPNRETMSGIALNSGAVPYDTASPGSFRDLMIQVISNF